jgi:gamma-glutamyltranspeptidase/glutathione hydrolase
VADDPRVPFATQYAPTGMVCSIDHLASGAGVAILRAGGSAADAAVATSAVLAVTSQHLCGMGGDLFALVHAGTGPPAVLNASGRAGSGADPARARADGLASLPLRGDIRSVPVPGCVDGWVALHGRFGRLPLAEVLEPAAGYAEHGFPASPTLAGAVPAVADLVGAGDYRTAAPVRPGDLIRRPGVAAALRAIGTGGRAAWYEGEFGDGLLRLGAGEYEPADLARVQADWVEPLGLRLWGVDTWTVPPNSQGYLTLSSARLAEGLPLPADPDDPVWAHLLVEAARQAGHDRLAVLHEGAEGPALLDEARLGPRRLRIGDHRAHVPVAPPAHDGDTIHLAVVDGDRMGVSLIQSNASGWGAHLVVPGPRVFLHDRGIGFSLEAGHPAEYGPGRRPPSTLSPALLTTPGGRLHGVLGTMGGDSQPQILLQLLARLGPAGQPPGDALAAGRWALASGSSGFATWTALSGDQVLLEGQAPGGWDAGLAARGHDVRRTAAFSDQYGHAHVILVEGDRLAGASDPRPRSGGAAGY